MKIYLIFFVISFCLSVNAALAEPDDHGHGAEAANEHGDHGENEEHGEHSEEGEHEEHGAERTHIAPDMAQQVGITTAVAGPGTLAQTVTVYGRVTTTPKSVSHIRARFPGLVTEVRATVGDTVQAGDVLASIESNESLKVYQVRSPIAGVITKRHANTGESTKDSVLFTVSNLDVLWANLKIFPSQRAQVSPGDTVVLSTDTLSQKATLRHLIPGSDGQPFVIARAELNNSDGRWVPGLLLEGSIQTNTIDAALVVPEQALQTLEGKTVVFVVEDDAFVARPVQTGRSDGQRTEILSGLVAGETYVVDNSYLIKADIEKSGAAHSH